MQKYKLTIYIVHYRKIKQLKRTVECLFQNTDIPFKIKILNNGYEDEEINAYFQELSKKENVEILRSKMNTGCSPARAVLSEKIDTPYAMSLDDDMYVSKNWLRDGLDFLEKNPKAGSMGFLFKEQGQIKFGGSNLLIQKNVIEVVQPKPTNDERFMEISHVGAGAFLYKQELKKYFSWDKNFIIGFEDEDVGLQLQSSGYKAYIDTKTVLFHDKVSLSTDKSFREYNKDRRNYRTIRKSYMHFTKKNNLRLNIKRHIFYKYFCLLPNFVSKNVASSWLRFKK